MKKSLLSAAIAAASIILSQAAHADRVKGSAKADFSNDEMQVPCVQIQGYSDAADGQFFDIVLTRRGNSFNYELTFAEPEDAAICEELANYAIFIDDDEEEDDEDDMDDENESEDDEEDEEEDDNDSDPANLFASCEVRFDGEEQSRSKIKVKAKDLDAGDYYAVVSSGDNSIQSESISVDDDEVEFEFDSDPDDVAEGAEAVEAGFIQNSKVTAELFAAAGDELLLSEEVSCLQKD